MPAQTWSCVWGALWVGVSGGVLPPYDGGMCPVLCSGLVCLPDMLVPHANRVPSCADTCHTGLRPLSSSPAIAITAATAVVSMEPEDRRGPAPPTMQPCHLLALAPVQLPLRPCPGSGRHRGAPCPQSPRAGGCFLCYTWVPRRGGGSRRLMCDPKVRVLVCCIWDAPGAPH